MKKLIASVTMALALTVAATAQVAVGVKGIGAIGLGTTLPKEQVEQLDDLISTAKEWGFEDASWKLSPIFTGGFGVYGRYYIPAIPSLGVQAEVDMLFNNGGSAVFKASAPGISYDITQTVKYNTLEIPVLVVYDIKAGPVTIGLNAGPDFVIPLGKVKESQVAEMTGVDPAKSEEESEIASKFIVGAIAGADVKFDMGPVTLGLGLQYELDFMPMKLTAEGADEEAESITRRGLRVSLGCEMKL